jgi:Integrase core domain/Integrase zinc binding domain
MARHFFWRRMSKDVARWVKECDLCQRNKPDIQRTGVQLTQPLAIPAAPGEHVSVDFMELPRTTAGNDYLMVVVDKFTKLVRMAPCTKEITVQDAAEMFMALTLPTFARLPTFIISDRDHRFTSEMWSSLWDNLGTKLAMTTAHRPQGDGQTERANRQIQEYLRNFVNALGTDWDNRATLAQLEFAINSQRSAATEASAFELHLSRLPVPPAATSTTQAARLRGTPTFDEIQARWERAKEAMREAQDASVPDTALPPNRPTIVSMLVTRCCCTPATTLSYERTNYHPPTLAPSQSNE